MFRCLPHLLVVALLLAACGSAEPVGAPTTPPTPAVADSGLLDGVSRDCMLLDDVSDEVVRSVRDRIDPAVAHGPVVAVSADDGGYVVGTALYEDDGSVGATAVWGVSMDPPDTATAYDDVASQISDIAQGAVPQARVPLRAEAEDCAHAAAAEVRPTPATTATPAMRPDLLTVTPDPVAPGTVVEVAFAESYPRGIAWQLDARVDDTWETRFWLTSDANGGDPVAVAVGTDGYGVEDVGVEGTGPDRLRVPAEAAPGEYRLCTANARDDVCVPLTVAEG